MTLDENAEVVTAQDYYPYGEILRSYSLGGLNDKYKFTEKERDTETNYDYFGARFYDSELGRWLSVDPLADKYFGWSPYNYTLNNSLNNIDLLGLAAAKAQPVAPPFWFYQTNYWSYSPKYVTVPSKDDYLQYEDYLESNLGKGIGIKGNRKNDDFQKASPTLDVLKRNALLKKVKNHFYSADHSFFASIKRFFTTFNKLNSKMNNNGEQPYYGFYRGFGISTDIGVPHIGTIQMLGYIKWIKENPNESKKMIYKYINFLKQVNGF